MATMVLAVVVVAPMVAIARNALRRICRNGNVARQRGSFSWFPARSRRNGQSKKKRKKKKNKKKEKEEKEEKTEQRGFRSFRRVDSIFFGRKATFEIILVEKGPTIEQFVYAKA